LAAKKEGPQEANAVKLLAVCTAATVDVVTHRATTQPPGKNWRMLHGATPRRQ